MNKHISIIGCGWLGLPLATELLKSGHFVKGSTTSVDKVALLKNAGIRPFLISISDVGITGPIEEFLKDSEILVINIPPGLRKNPDANFVKQMDFLCKHIETSTVKQVLYVSSTSVYEDVAKLSFITEESPTDGQSAAAKQLIAAEQIFKTNPNFETTILRFAGLIGDDRNPAKFLSGKNNIKDPEGPVNLIHQKDAIGLIKAIINNQHWNTDFNAASPQHPTRKAYYTSLCIIENLPIPQFEDSGPSLGKIISSEKVERILKYGFQHHL
ncbi:NAD(P)H-binding protein [Gelidibacter sp.]|uniref:NAD(P)H-binding protein n=1 Tax=Gelidibacter sp. TaxID=2018083 RepID=UPI002C232F59|nr:NAD(P)H-binding protein [Gelidibacter sp.]HUH27228.1 NAD(P)H-binding protein [Gelidibacter sp.]